MLRKQLHLQSYKLSMLQAITVAEICTHMLQWIEDDREMVTGVCNLGMGMTAQN
jgi:hypothetical protein